MIETSKQNRNILNDSLVAYITKKHKQKVYEALKNDPDIDFEKIIVNEYIVLSPEMDHKINVNIFNYIDECTTDLQNKNLEQINEYLQSDKAKNLSEKYIPEIIITITGVICFTRVGGFAAALIVRPYIHMYFYSYLNSFIEYIISGTYIPYKAEIFDVNDSNLMDYLGAILAAYLTINPEQAFDKGYDYTDTDLINRLKSSLKTFFYFYDELETSDKLKDYVEAFISEMSTTSKEINAHILPYAKSKN
jgi:predicted house-cleaning noncanonical NTP pyrophosphatase (MazG superfamily)